MRKSIKVYWEHSESESRGSEHDDKSLEEEELRRPRISRFLILEMKRSGTDT